MMRPAATVAGFMFHEITDDPATSGYQRPGARPYCVSPERFRRYLDVLADRGLEPATIGDVDFDAPVPRLMMTFDDGGRSAIAAGDLLQRRGWRGHFFVVTSRIGRPGFLDGTGIRYLRSCGHLIGTHSHTHPDIFPRLSIGEMAEEWSASRSILEHLLGEPVLIASLPGGDLSARVRDSVRRSAFHALFTSEPWLHPRRAGACWLVGRFAVRSSLHPETFRSLADLRGWSSALLRRRCSVLARLGLGPLYRHYVRRLTEADRTPAPVR
jgi:peptidoglycan/xylan/chitin deacetylase (PgdA/CDA1 family)